MGLASHLILSSALKKISLVNQHRSTGAGATFATWSGRTHIFHFVITHRAFSARKGNSGNHITGHKELGANLLVWSGGAWMTQLSCFWLSEASVLSAIVWI